MKPNRICIGYTSLLVRMTSMCVDGRRTVGKYNTVPGGYRFIVQLIIKSRRIYADMNESSGTPWWGSIRPTSVVACPLRMPIGNARWQWVMVVTMSLLVWIVPSHFPVPREAPWWGSNRFVGGWGKFKTSNLISAAFGSGAQSRSWFTNL